MFDILFRNAKVIDGTGNPWFYGDVGVEGGTVAAVLPPGSTARARRVADVDGKALCPGFVDGHSHSELPLLAGEGMDCKIMQGVTTENLGLDGMSLAPIKDGDKVVIIEDVTTAGTSIEETLPIIKAQGDVDVLALVVSVDRMERGQGEKSALMEIEENYGLKTTAIVTMAEVVEHLYNKPYKGKVVIDDTLKAAIDAYYEQYGVK